MAKKILRWIIIILASANLCHADGFYTPSFVQSQSGTSSSYGAVVPIPYHPTHITYIYGLIQICRASNETNPNKYFPVTLPANFAFNLIGCGFRLNSQLSSGGTACWITGTLETISEVNIPTQQRCITAQARSDISNANDLAGSKHILLPSKDAWYTAKIVWGF